MLEQQRIVILSDSLSGGAAVACSRLCESLAARGVAFERWHFSPQSGNAPEYNVSLDPRGKRPPLERIIKNISQRAANRMRHRRHGQTFSDRMIGVRPALLNIHSIHDCGLNHESLLNLPCELPMVWTLHDCWPFAVEAYRWTNSSLGCEETAACDGPSPELAARRRKTFFGSRSSVMVVGPSRWITEAARVALSGTARAVHIPYGLDLGAFCPVPMAFARKELGLDTNRAWIGFASTWANTRKGADILLKSLSLLDCRALGLLVWGTDPQFDWPAQLHVRYIGKIVGEARLATLYSACDLMICPSRADNLPNVVLESLACGTPVIGSSVGGIPDMVRNGETGWLFDTDKPEHCAAAIRQALADRKHWPRFRATCREIATKEYAAALQAERYQKLYDEVSSRP